MNDERIDLYKQFEKINYIDPSYYEKFRVKRGLRNADGTGVLAGMTNISNVHGYLLSDGDKLPDEGSLRLRGYEITDLLGEESSTTRFSFEEVAYLLLLGELPTRDQLDTFIAAIDAQRELPDGFTASMILKDTPPDIMNVLARSILLLYAYDPDAEDRSPEHEINTAISLMSRVPRMMVLTYYAQQARYHNGSMIMHRFIPGQSTAETILSMLRPNREFTPEEARMLDVMLCLHAEHGGGNNSTFTTRVITSSGSDTYSTIAAAMSSLKGPKHGGANIKVMEMMEDIRLHVSDCSDKEALADYLAKIINRDAFDRKGLVYGMGHAVYSLSDPRERIFKGYVEKLAAEKGRGDDLTLYRNVEELAPQLIAKHRRIYKGVSPNVDFYSGFVYDMLGIPQELYTAMFAVARIVGWSAHRIEELICMDKIIRPAYMSVMEERE